MLYYFDLLKKKNIFKLNSQKTFLLILLIFMIRVLSILNSPLGLSVDEAQYWDWSNNLQFGYFSKPPLIAWLIACTTYFFGMSEWSVRLSAPIIHCLITLMVWLISKNVYNVKIANLSALIWAILPLNSFGSLIISTDTPLLLFWCISLFTLLKTLESNKIFWPILLGISLGLGFLTKYAALYFVIILICLIIFNHRFRKNILKFILSICVFLIVCTPNFYWNYLNDFSTISHTAYNANLNVISLNYIEPIKFIATQLIICGPFILIAYLFKITKIKLNNENEFLLIFFSLPILVIIIIQAFLKTSNANWAATAFPAIIILIGSFFYYNNKSIFKVFIILNLMLNFCIFLFLTKAFITGSLYPIQLKSDPLRKLKGYSEISKKINLIIKKEKLKAILFTKRNDIAKFSYYLKTDNENIKRFYLTLRHSPINHYEYFYDFRTHDLKKEDIVLIINHSNKIHTSFSKYFTNLNNFGTITLNTTSDKTVKYHIIKGTIN